MISVVMATYNDAPDALDAAMRSVEGQTLQDWELVVADDSTRPESIAVLERHAALLGDRMVYRHHEKRLGLVGSINEALALAKGDLIARMDGDDECVPDRLEIQAAFLGSRPEVGILGGDIEVMNDAGRSLSVRRYKRGRAPYGGWLSSAILSPSPRS